MSTPAVKGCLISKCFLWFADVVGLPTYEASIARKSLGKLISKCLGRLGLGLSSHVWQRENTAWQSALVVPTA